MEVAYIVFGVPLGATVVAGVPLYFFSASWLLRLWNAALATQVSLVAAAWLLLALAPDEQNWREPLGSTCPDLDGFNGDAIVTVGLCSVAVGAVSLASAVLAAFRDASGFARILVALGVSAAPLAIFVPLLGAAFCGSG